MNNNNNTVSLAAAPRNTDAMVFLITVWTVVRATMGRAQSTTIADMRAFQSFDATMAYIAGLDDTFRAEVRPITIAELYTDYAELVRNAATAGLISNGVATDGRDCYMVPMGAQAAAQSYKTLSLACGALHVAAKVRRERPELVSLKDRANALSNVFAELSVRAHEV